MTFYELSNLNETECREYFERIRWPEGVRCAHCEHDHCYKLKGEAHREGVYKCAKCRKQFTVTVGTIMHRSHISLKKWLLALHLMCASKKAISACQLQRALDLKSYKSAWHLCHRIRHAMAEEPLKGMLSGIVEADETYVGGKPRKGDGKKRKRGRGTEKAPVVALVERNGKVVSQHMEKLTAKKLQGAICDLVAEESTIMSDEYSSYKGVGKYFKGGHQTINHGRGEYAKGDDFDIHCNTAESFFSLLKRGVTGAYHHVSKKHLHRYCAEFDFRWNTRDWEDGDRMDLALQRSVGKRLPYKEPEGEKDD